MNTKKYTEIDNLDRLYQAYRNMKSRCYCKTDARYKYYGGKGITVCDEWLENFKTFYAWSIANDYADDLFLVRKDKEQGYCPENCEWLTESEKMTNSKKVHWRTYKQETHSVATWAKMFGLHRCVLNNRLRRGMPFEEAIKKQPRVYRSYRRKDND